MDLHHRLRRDPTWHRDGCNICGTIGHQAAQCPNGTVDWVGAWGSDDAYVAAFTPAPDGLAVEAARAARKAGPGPEALAAMAAAARAWADGRAASGAAAAEPIPPPRRPPRAAVAAAAAAGPPGPYAGGGMGMAPPAMAGGGPGPLPPGGGPPGAPPPPPLPPGWRAAWDGRKGRYYFYSRADRGRVQWTVPTGPA